MLSSLLTHRRLLIPLYFALLSAISLGGYLLFSYSTYRLGFPLDDAWIHQTYARNLAWRGEWSFLPGQPSAGSTAPLWSIFLAVGHAVRIGPYVWSYLLGWALLCLLGLAGYAAFQRLRPASPAWAIAAGSLLVIEWHLVWAAGSGMETLLFALGVLSVLGWLACNRVNWLGLGLLTGLSLWIRPDGITLIGPAMLTLVLTQASWSHRGRAFARFVLGLAMLAVPYLVFNRLLAGAWWPNTFFAKQAEYAVLSAIPIWKRFLSQAGPPLVGAGALLLPGFIFSLVDALRLRKWAYLAGGLWVAGFLLLYAWRLPVTYQHGRYIMPAMPVFFIWGVSGMAGWIQGSASTLSRRVLAKSWMASTGLVLALFWIMGGRAYARDVAIIETEMVETAHWVATHTDASALIAAHDIGALGYFANRDLLDLAGLVSPEVIPFIRDEDRIADLLTAQDTDYLVTFPAWYPGLTGQALPLYRGQANFSQASGGENMVVYQWNYP